MKSFVLPIALAIAALSAVSSADQLQPPSPQPRQQRIVPPPEWKPVPGQPNIGNPGAPGNSTNNTALETNHRITLTGSFGEKREIDLSVTGIGPRFDAEALLPENGNLTASFVASRAPAGILISYTVGLRVMVTTVGNNFEYRDLTYKGQALCQTGEPVVIYKNGTQSLTLTIAEAKTGAK